MGHVYFFSNTQLCGLLLHQSRYPLGLFSHLTNRTNSLPPKGAAGAVSTVESAIQELNSQ